MKVGYHKAALLTIVDDRILLCRKKRGTSLLILPGGRIENGETPEQCLLRELNEELGNVKVEGLRFLGTFEDVAAGDETKLVRVELYEGNLFGNPRPRSEIAELVWFGRLDNRQELAPSIRNQILPELIRRGIIAWENTRGA